MRLSGRLSWPLGGLALTDPMPLYLRVQPGSQLQARSKAKPIVLSVSQMKRDHISRTQRQDQVLDVFVIIALQTPRPLFSGHNREEP